MDVGEEWELPYREKRRKNAKPDTITLTLPARGISTLLAATTTATKTSVRLELKLTSTILKAGGADINQASLSVSTVYRQRKKKVKQTASDIRKRIKNLARKNLNVS